SKPCDPVDPIDCGCGCDCGCGSCSATPKGPAIPKTNGESVRYATGEVVLQEEDIHADGFGQPWGHTRSFASRLTQDSNTGNGANWQVKQLPYLVHQEDGSVAVMGQANSVLWFDQVGDALQPRFGGSDSLTLDGDAGSYQLTDVQGCVSEFDATSGM